MKSKSLFKLTLSAMFVALGWLLPFVTLQIPQIGRMLLPMHLPVLVAGFILGPIYGAFVGFIIPITRSFIFGMPVLFPQALCMAFELMAYGFVSGMMYLLLKKIKWPILRIYLSLIIALILGRCVWGFVAWISYGFTSTSFTWNMFLFSILLSSWPGIILQLILIPPLVYAISRIPVVKNLEKKEEYEVN